MIDAHAHLCAEEFATDLAEVLDAAAAAGVSAVVSVSENLDDAHRTLEIAERFPSIRPAAGLYPTHLDGDEAEEMIRFIRENRDRLVAIGEVGLDHWVTKEEDGRAIQRSILERFVALSLELDLPLNVHSRSAGRAVIELLAERGGRRVLLHAFDAKVGTALKGVEQGFFFSIPPSVVRSRQKQKLVKALPLDRILLETDSPVLGPDPGVRNEPANLSVACRAVADLLGISPDELARRTTENARRLFGAQVF